MSFSMKQSSPTIWDKSVMFNKLLLVNNRPMGENMPNLVTLSKENWVNEAFNIHTKQVESAGQEKDSEKERNKETNK
jgi:hypothetical protein